MFSLFLVHIRIIRTEIQHIVNAWKMALTINSHSFYTCKSGAFLFQNTNSPLHHCPQTVHKHAQSGDNLNAKYKHRSFPGPSLIKQTQNRGKQGSLVCMCCSNKTGVALLSTSRVAAHPPCIGTSCFLTAWGGKKGSDECVSVRLVLLCLICQTLCRSLESVCAHAMCLEWLSTVSQSATD